VLLFELVEQHRASIHLNSPQLTSDGVKVLLKMRREYKHLFRRTLLFLGAGKKHAGQSPT
jgi:hypothetical protein